MQFVLLTSVWWLSDQHGSADRLPSQREAAAHAETDIMMTSQVLRALERRGLLTRTADLADARVKRLAMTEDGRRLAEQAITLVEAADATLGGLLEVAEEVQPTVEAYWLSIDDRDACNPRSSLPSASEPGDLHLRLDPSARPGAA